MKRLLLVSALLLCLPLSSRADDTSRRAKVQEMFDLMHMDRMMNQIMDTMMKQMTAVSDQMMGNSVTPEVKAKVAAFQSQVVKVVEDQVGWKAMEPTLLNLYAQNYTDDELDGIIAFYKSPAGRSMLEKMPQLSAQSMQLTQQKLILIQPQLKQMVENFSRDMAQTNQPTQTPADRNNSVK